MRASHLALIVAVLALPSAAYSQDSGQVDGRVGSDLGTSSMQPSPSMGSTGAYRRPPEPGPRAGVAGAVMPGHVVPESMPGYTRERHRLRRSPPRNSQPELDSHPASGPLN
jgi:hypothetical protein